MSATFCCCSFVVVLQFSTKSRKINFILILIRSIWNHKNATYYYLSGIRTQEKKGYKNQTVSVCFRYLLATLLCCYLRENRFINCDGSILIIILNNYWYKWTFLLILVVFVFEIYLYIFYYAIFISSGPI